MFDGFSEVLLILVVVLMLFGSQRNTGNRKISR